MSTLYLWARSEINFILSRLGTMVGNEKEWRERSGKYSWLFTVGKSGISYWWSTLRCKSEKVLAVTTSPCASKILASAMSSTCVVSYQLFWETHYLLSLFSINLTMFHLLQKYVIVQNQWFDFFALFLLVLPFWALIASCNNLDLKKSLQFSNLFVENVLFLACVMLPNTASSGAMK